MPMPRSLHNHRHMSYEQQERGDRSAYDRYLRGMDASMKQKVALTAAHLLASGRVADMGMGSGTGSYALAALYPSLEVVGVDINPTMVELAAERHRLPNLSFTTSDIAVKCFPDASLDGIFDSSVLHHVTTFSGYDHGAAVRALEVQARMLREHGMLIVRDFVDPGEGEVLLDLPEHDGDDTDDPSHCSTAALFLRFAREFRKLHTRPGFEYSEEPSPVEGIRRFRVTKKLAAEFVLRKDYRADWDTEVLEEYTYLTQQQFEEVFTRIGLRIVASTPLWNPWIIRNRYQGRFAMRSVDGADLEFPPTNYLIAGERVASGEGVTFVERERVGAPGFLTMDHHRDRRTGAVMDLVRRPHPTIDVVPWFESDGEVFVIARKSYPRPITAAADVATLDGATPARYVTEPLNVLQQDKPLGRTVVESLAACASIAGPQVRRFMPGAEYYPSPGGIEEQVRSALVEVDPAFAQVDIGAGSGFSSSGHVRAIEATQLLRAAQVGGLSDARLELNVHHLLRTLGRSPGAWIGDAVAITAEAGFDATSIAALERRAQRRVFEPADASASRGFLELRASRFDEVGAEGATVATQLLEYVVPRTLGINTIATALLARSGDGIMIGLDDDDLPAAQSFNGNSELLVAPAWRLPRDVRTRHEAQEWTATRIAKEYGLRAAKWFELGGMYHPSPGVTPERVYPFAVEIDARIAEGERAIHWVRIEDAVANADRLRDGHLRIVLFRAAHALGML